MLRTTNRTVVHLLILPSQVVLFFFGLFFCAPCFRVQLVPAHSKTTASLDPVNVLSKTERVDACLCAVTGNGKNTVKRRTSSATVPGATRVPSVRSAESAEPKWREE